MLVTPCMKATVFTNYGPAPALWTTHSHAFISTRISSQVFTGTSLLVKDTCVSVVIKASGFRVTRMRIFTMFRRQQAHRHHVEGPGYGVVPCFVV